jgi:hypothetical protein
MELRMIHGIVHFGAFCGLAMAFCCGCGQTPDAAPSAGTTPAASTAGPPVRETWDVYRMAGAKIGYGRTTVRRATDKDGARITTESLMHMKVQRYGEATQQEIRVMATETPEGVLRTFHSEIQDGPMPVCTTGEVHGDRLQLEMTSAGKTTRTSVPWSAQYGGPFAFEESLRHQPMKPGERRKIKAWDVSNQVTETDMTARQYEQTPLLSGSFSLLRIDALNRMPDGQTITSVAWTDSQGEVLKSRVEPNIEAMRVPEEVAKAEGDIGNFDLGRNMHVKVDRPLPRVHDGHRVRYRVTLDGGNPADAFPNGASQKVTSLGTERAEVTVYPLRPGVAGNAAAHEEAPTAAQRRPNNFLQSDDPKVMADAHEAVGSETDPWRKALALERYVFQAIKKNDYSQAFATAAEVARDRQGDCTEHAVYLAAMARSVGIPSRVAIGLVYLSSTQTFDYHMWTELYIDGRWIGLDGTMAKGGIGGGHLKLAHSSLDGVAAYSSFLPVLKVLGRLRVEVVEMD